MLSYEIGSFVLSLQPIGRSLTDQLQLPDIYDCKKSQSLTDQFGSCQQKPIAKFYDVEPGLLFNRLSFTHLAAMIPVKDPIGFGENLGSGFPKILDAWKEAKWNAPTLEDRLTTEEVRLTLPIPFAEFTAETTTQKPVENSDENRPNVADNVANKLTDRQLDLLNLIAGAVANNVAVNIKYLAEKLYLNRKTIQRDMAVLQEKKLVIWVGTAKSGYWKFIGESVGRQE